MIYRYLHKQWAVKLHDSTDKVWGEPGWERSRGGGACTLCYSSYCTRIFSTQHDDANDLNSVNTGVELLETWISLALDWVLDLWTLRLLADCGLLTPADSTAVLGVPSTVHDCIHYYNANKPRTAKEEKCEGLLLVNPDWPDNILCR